MSILTVDTTDAITNGSMILNSVAAGIAVAGIAAT